MLGKENNDLDEAIRKALLGQEEEAPNAAGWFIVKAKLAQEGIKIGLGKTAIKFLQFSVAAVVTAGTAVGVYVYNSETNKNNTSPSQIATTVSETVTENNLSESATTANNSSSANTAKTPVVSELAHNKANTQNTTTAANATNTNLLASLEKAENKNKNVAATSKGAKNHTAAYASTKNTSKQSLLSTTETESNTNEANADATELTSSEAEVLNITKNTVETETNAAANEVINADSVSNTTEPASTTTLAETKPTAIVDSINCISENNTVLIDTSYKKFVVGVYASFDRNYYELKNGNTELTGGAANFGSEIKGKNSVGQFTFGLTGGFKISQRTVIESGLFYSQKKQIDFTSPTYTVNPNPGDLLSQTENQFSYSHKARYVQLSVKAKIYVVDVEKVRLFVAPGMIFESNIPTSNNNQSYYQITSNTFDKSTVKKYRFESGSIGSNALIAAGVEYKLPDNWLVSFEPAYIYGLNQIIRYKGSNTVAPVKHYNRAINLGLRIMKEF